VVVAERVEKKIGERTLESEPGSSLILHLQALDWRRAVSVKWKTQNYLKEFKGKEWTKNEPRQKRILRKSMGKQPRPLPGVIIVGA